MRVPGIQALRQRPRLDALVSEMWAVAEEQQERGVQDRRPFSQRYKERWVALRRVAEESGRIAVPPQGFAMAMPVRLNNTELPAEANAALDPDTGQLILQVNPQSQPLLLNFAGEQYVIGRPAGAEVGPRIEIDQRQYRISLPRSPHKLVAPDERAARLAQWFRRHERRAEVVRAGEDGGVREGNQLE
jgi:hypothetical protein